jgi:hypothetical protein
MSQRDVKNECSPWTVCDKREAYGVHDIWEEYLCVRRAPGGWEVAVCQHDLLREVASEWFDENGEPLPEYRDEHGALKLPDVVDGQEVWGFDGEYILGRLVPSNADSNRICVGDLDEVFGLDALASLDWPRTALGALLAAVHAHPT